MSLEDWFNKRWYPEKGEGRSLSLLTPLELLYGGEQAAPGNEFSHSTGALISSCHRHW
ncbi:hypothetical protein QT397_15890 [Microbulbifer sp. MKSA007]|nr:hypothetical protein QT397_15890 [Microbulbifer sp. MKSA007]